MQREKKQGASKPTNTGVMLGSMTSGWLYALTCVVVPGLWGVAMYYVFGLVERRRQKSIQRDAPPPVDYSI